MAENNEQTTDRRDFLRTCGCMLAGVAIVGMAPLVGGCEFSHVNTPPDDDDDGGSGRTVDIDVSGLTVDSTAMLSTQRGPDRKLIAVVLKGGVYSALSTECPHSRFAVAPVPDRSQFYCTGGQGHNSQFTLEGTAITGPALGLQPLKRYPSTYDAARKVLTVDIG